MINIRKNRINMITVLLITGLCMGILLAGCSDEDTDSILPNVVLSLTSLNFGEVNVGQFFVATVTVRNLTSGNVIVERVTSTNDVFQVGGYFSNNQLIALEMPFSIETNASRTLYIGFYPQAEQQYEGKVVIESITEDTSRQETDLLDVLGVGVSNQE
ncbi:hypothetical protein U27_06686 [Candidatus Vecturithrix granuli]|uniref:Cep192/Spd-2-like domain-containing protein n=1 Tax=Vecturithrix granuli TaxID=1499967 RepID=A0A081C546_VECG1|nr:hypothetical protein U27_06686 [Candidatus Vecturithrix granuli]